MKEISRVESETVNLEGLADKVNEIVDAMNSLLENVRYIRPKVSLERKDICTCTRKYMKCNYHDVKLTEID